MGLLDFLFARRQPVNDLEGAPHLRAKWPAAIYAIGDIHGCIDQLVALEGRIERDGASVPGEKWIVTVGDYVDRGPASSEVIDHLMTAPADGFHRVALMGNHELMMRRALRDVRNMPLWLDNGGKQTLQSYGFNLEWLERSGLASVLEAANSRIPAHHMEFLGNLALSLSIADDVIIVHSGVVAAAGVERSSEAELLWSRPDGANDEGEGPLIVHGHTPVGVPYISSRRINIDTGACVTGKLTALRLIRGQAPVVL